jgi:TonB family protein
MRAGFTVVIFVLLANTASAQQPERLSPDIVPPRAITKIYPRYSDTARDLRIEGTVIVQAIVHKSGAIEVLGLRQGLGYGLDENAVLAMRRMRFQPAIRNGTPVDVEMDIAVKFSLDDSRLLESQEERPFPKSRFCERMSDPVPVSRVHPELTRAARDAGISGTVAIDATVQTDGSVEVIRVRNSLGYGLDSAAIAAIGKWIFRPATCNGAPRETTLAVEVNFGGK